MKLNRILSAELGAAFQTKAAPGMGDFTEFFALLTNSEQKIVQSLHAQAFRRAVRRVRANSRRSS